MDIDTVSLHPTYLPFLPYHILYSISTYLDERSTWRAMATCQALREAAEKALKWHLGTMTVIADPPLLSSIYEPLNITSALDNKRWRDLDSASNRALNLMLEYPPAATQLRDLKVELRTEEEGNTWLILDEAQPHIQQLEIHINDANARMSTDEADDYSTNIRGLSGTWLAWPFWLNSHSPHQRPNFPHLTSLTIASTARTLGHFGQLAGGLPNLQELTLSAHRESGLEPDGAPVPPMPRLPKLRSFTLSGDPQSVLDILGSIIPSSGRFIRFLIMHVDSFPSSDVDFPDQLALAVTRCPRLRGLGIYGGLGIDVLRSLKIRQDENARLSFPNLVFLVLERRDWYPILDQPMNEWITLPALSRLTIVDHQFPSRSHPDLFNFLRTRGQPSGITLSIMKDLFIYYKTLGIARLLTERPIYPFDVPLATPRQQGVQCQVLRVPGTDELRMTEGSALRYPGSGGRCGAEGQGSRQMILVC